MKRTSINCFLIIGHLIGKIKDYGMVRAKSVQIIKSLKTEKHPHMPPIVLTLSLPWNCSYRPILTVASMYLVVQS